MFGHDPAHTGRSEVSTAAALVTKWEIGFDGTVGNKKELQSGPVIGPDNTLYVGGYTYTCTPEGNCAPDNTFVDAVDPAGHLKWEYKVSGSGGGGSSPAIGPDGTIYRGMNDHIGADDLWSLFVSGRTVRHLYAINPDGTLKWKLPTGRTSVDTLVVGANGTIYGAAQCGRLFAVDADGTLRWSFNTGGIFTNGCAEDSYPAIGKDGTIYVGIDLPSLIESYHPTTQTILNAIGADGQLKWRFPVGLGGGTPAIGTDGTVYLGNCEGTFYALNPDGSLKWKLRIEKTVLFGTPAIGADGTIYVGNDDVARQEIVGGHFNAIGVDGKLKWRVLTKPILETPAISASGTIYVGSRDEARPLYAFSPDGKLIWKLEGFGGQPAIGRDGTLYVRGRNGMRALGSASR